LAPGLPPASAPLPSACSLSAIAPAPGSRKSNRCRQAGGKSDAITKPPAQYAPSRDGDAKVAMVNGTFLLSFKLGKKVAGQTWSTRPYCRPGHNSAKHLTPSQNRYIFPNWHGLFALNAAKPRLGRSLGGSKDPRKDEGLGGLWLRGSSKGRTPMENMLLVGLFTGRWVLERQKMDVVRQTTFANVNTNGYKADRSRCSRNISPRAAEAKAIFIGQRPPGSATSQGPAPPSTIFFPRRGRGDQEPARCRDRWRRLSSWCRRRPARALHPRPARLQINNQGQAGDGRRQSGTRQLLARSYSSRRTSRSAFASDGKRQPCSKATSRDRLGPRASCASSSFRAGAKTFKRKAPIFIRPGQGNAAQPNTTSKTAPGPSLKNPTSTRCSR